MQIQGSGFRPSTTQTRGVTGAALPGTSQGDSGSSTASASLLARTTITDTFTPRALDPDERDRLVEKLTRMRDEISGTSPRGVDENDKLKSLLELSDDEFDRGLSFYDKHRDKTRAVDPYLTDSDRAMVGLMYEKYENKFGEESPQLDKVTRFAAELATLRMTGALVQTKEQKEAEAARDDRRTQRAEAAKKEEAARVKASEERDAQVNRLETRIEDLRTPSEAAEANGTATSDHTHALDPPPRDTSRVPDSAARE